MNLPDFRETLSFEPEKEVLTCKQMLQAEHLFLDGAGVTAVPDVLSGIPPEEPYSTTSRPIRSCSSFAVMRTRTMSPGVRWRSVVT